MIESGSVLGKQSDFDQAMQQQLHVEVYQYGELLDEGGPIESHDLHKVTIGGMHFFKSTCLFMIQGA